MMMNKRTWLQKYIELHELDQPMGLCPIQDILLEQSNFLMHLLMQELIRLHDEESRPNNCKKPTKSKFVWFFRLFCRTYSKLNCDHSTHRKSNQINFSPFSKNMFNQIFHVSCHLWSCVWTRTWPNIWLVEHSKKFLEHSIFFVENKLKTDQFVLHLLDQKQELVFLFLLPIINKFQQNLLFYFLFQDE